MASSEMQKEVAEAIQATLLNSQCAPRNAIDAALLETARFALSEGSVDVDWFVAQARAAFSEALRLDAN